MGHKVWKFSCLLKLCSFKPISKQQPANHLLVSMSESVQIGAPLVSNIDWKVAITFASQPSNWEATYHVNNGRNYKQVQAPTLKIWKKAWGTKYTLAPTHSPSAWYNEMHHSTLYSALHAYTWLQFICLLHTLVNKWSIRSSSNMGPNCDNTLYLSSTQLNLLKD